MLASQERRLFFAIGFTLVLALASLAALAATPKASAFVGPNPVETDWSKTWSTTQIPTAAETGTGAATPEARSLLEKARRRAGTMPKLRVLGTIGLGITAFELGWKIGRTIDTRWLHLSASAAVGTTALNSAAQHRVAAVKWQWRLAGSCSFHGCTGIWQIPSDGWYLEWRECSNACASPTVNSAAFTNPNANIGLLVAAGAPVGEAVQTGTGVYMWSASEAGMEAEIASDANEVYVDQPFSRYSTMTLPADPGAQSTAAADIREGLLGGGPAADLEIGVVVDPSWQGEPFEWSASVPEETYTVYLARLRAAGWLGALTVVNLDSSNGDVDYGLGGVPCTSVMPGTTVGSGSGATFYVNPTSGGFADDSQPQSGPTCGGARATSLQEPRCNFHGSGGPLADIIAGNEQFYEDACQEARAYLAAQSVFSSDGTVDPSLEIDFITDGTNLENPEVISLLSPFGGMDNWEKVRTNIFTGAPNEFEVHFYRNKTTQKAYYLKDFTIRYRYVFRP